MKDIYVIISLMEQRENNIFTPKQLQTHKQRTYYINAINVDNVGSDL